MAGDSLNAINEREDSSLKYLSFPEGYDDKAHPLYMNALVLTNFSDEIKSEYQEKKTTIEKSDIKSLRNLVSPKRLEALIAENIKVLPRFIPFSERKKLMSEPREQIYAESRVEKNLIDDVSDRLISLNKHFMGSAHDAYTIMDSVFSGNLEIGKALEKLNTISETLSKAINQVQKKGLRDYHSILSRFRNMLSDDLSKKLLDTEIVDSELTSEKAFIEYLNVKISRAKALQWVDPNLARVYLGFNPFIYEAIKIGNVQDLEITVFDFPDSTDNIYSFIIEDNKLYESILNDAFVEKKEKNADSTQITPYEMLYSAITANKDGTVFTPEMAGRIDSFAKTVASSEYGHVGSLCEAFRGMKFAEKIMRSRSRRDPLTDIYVTRGMQTFFSALEGYVNLGKTPTPGELNKLFKSNPDFG